MKRWINLAQWVAFVAVAAGVVWVVLKPSPPVRYDPATWSNWDGFMTISYAGVSRNASSLYPSSRILAEHFEALQAAGYNTITPDDALAFLERREPLPDKAVLILFEGARKETFVRAQPVLSRLGLRATLCMPTESVENWDESKLKRRDIQKITQMPQWSLASMGREAGNMITVSARGAEDHFLSRRKWIERAKREENDEEFRQRIDADYRDSAALLRKVNGSPVSAYVYPYADNGRRVDADPLAADLNFASLTSHYHLAFVSASNPFNPPGRNRFALSRLRIGGDWSAAQVLTQLKQARPRAVAGIVPVDGPEHWMLLNGAYLVNGELRLKSGAAAWIKGSDFWTEAEITGSLIRALGAKAVCYIRFNDPANCLRLTISDKDMRLQESRNGIPVTVAVAPTPEGENLHLAWRVKGNRSWLTANGRTVFGPAPLAESNGSGLIGFESNQGRVSFAGVSVMPLVRRGALVNSWNSLPAQRRGEITELFATFPPADRELGVQQRMDFVQAVAEGASVWPLLHPATTNLPPPAQVEALSAMLTRADLRPFIKGFVIDSALAEWAAPLRDRGFNVMHRVKAGERIPIAATNRVDFVWLEGTGSNVVVAAKDFLHRHPPSQLIVQDESVARGRYGVGYISE